MLANYKESLKNIGLTDKEANVYLTLLELASATADQVSKIAHLNRSTVYVKLESLMQAGLVSTYKKGKKTFFRAEAPSNLERIHERKQKSLLAQKLEIETFIPELMKSFVSHDADLPVVRLFEGKEGLATMRNSILETDISELLLVTNYNVMTEIFSPKELKTFTSKREELRILSRIIYYLAEGDDFKPYKYQNLRRITNEKTLLGADVYVYGNSVSFAAVEDKITGVTIENASIAASMRTLFEQTWQKLS